MYASHIFLYFVLTKPYRLEVMNKRTASYWKNRLELTQHVEGGAFKEVYRSQDVLRQNVLSKEHNGDRNISTAIYFLLTFGDFSAFHRIASDELWHHYDGDTLHVYEITLNGELITHKLGKDEDAQPQLIIPAGSWFASRVETEGGFTLCGCTVAPGFDFEDFELADRELLQKEFPTHASLIEQLTRL